MKKVIYPGPAIPTHMADSAYYPVHGITFMKGENLVEDDIADYHLAAGNVRLPDAPAGETVRQPPASEVPPRGRRVGSAPEGEN
jgi:hypothetical protein